MAKECESTLFFGIPKNILKNALLSHKTAVFLKNNILLFFALCDIMLLDFK